MRRLDLTLSKALLGLILLWGPFVAASTVPLGDIATERVFRQIVGGTNNEYVWWAGYDIGFTQATGTFNIGLKIGFNLSSGINPDSALKSTWEQGIEDLWSGRFQVVQDSSYFYNVLFDVTFVTSGMHHRITVREGPGDWNMNNWYTGSPSGWGMSYHDEAAAHEAGHMFGAFDEYAGGAVNPDGSYASVYDSLMGYGLTHTLYERNYKFITDWVAGKTGNGQTFSLAAAPPLASAVPLPPSLLLFLTGLIGLSWAGARQRFLNR